MQLQESVRVRFVEKEWQTLSKNYLKARTGLSLNSPHIVIREIFFEEENRNEYSARKYEMFKVLLQRDLGSVISEYIPHKTKLNALVVALNSKDSVNICMLSTSLKSVFESGEYFDNLFKFLRSFLNSNSAYINNTRRVKIVIQQIYIELILKGYEIEEAKDFFSSIFSTCEVVGEKYRTKFPDHLIPNRRALSVRDIMLYISNLSFLERLDYLASYFYGEEMLGYCVFRIKGINVSEIIKLDEILFAPPGITSAEWNGLTFDISSLRTHEGNENLPICIQKCRGKTFALSAKNAFNEFERVIRTILLYYNAQVPQKIIRTSWLLFDEGGAFRYFYFQSKSNDIQLDALVLTSSKLSFLHDGESAVSIELADQYKTIEGSLYWYGRASLLDQAPDKLLFYWISIECLFNTDGIDSELITGKKSGEKIDLIHSVIIASMLLSELHERVWSIYYHFRDVAFWAGKSSGIPQDLLVQLVGKPDESLYIWEFMSMLPRLIESEKDHIIKEEMKTIYQQFTVPQEHQKLVESIVSQLSSEVLLLYRFRNLIVHHALNDGTLLPYYTWLAGSYAGVILRSIRKDLLAGLTAGQSINRMSLTVSKYLSFLQDGKIACVDDDLMNAMWT
jgi:hypothetical protein